jgi:hypothetical protein
MFGTPPGCDHPAGIKAQAYIITYSGIIFKGMPQNGNTTKTVVNQGDKKHVLTSQPRDNQTDGLNNMRPALPETAVLPDRPRIFTEY